MPREAADVLVDKTNYKKFCFEWCSKSVTKTQKHVVNTFSNAKSFVTRTIVVST